MNIENSSKGIGCFVLVLLMTGAIDSIRNLPVTALFGTTLIFFFIFAAIMFLIPTALVSAELAAHDSEKGGIYVWLTEAFGESWGFLAVWLQWVNTIIWCPTILSFLAGTLAFLIDPELAENKTYLITVVLVVFWLLTFINLKGLKISAGFASACTIFGMLLPMALIIFSGVIWLLLNKPLQIHMTAANMLPSLTHFDNWISLTAIIASFLGMELAAVHIKQIRNPQKIFPKATLYSVLLILITMIGGALTIAMIVPANHLNLVSGTMQAFSEFLTAFNMHYLIYVVAVMIFIGALGGMINWLISPTKGLHQAAIQGFLPLSFAKTNQHGAPTTVLIVQAIMVSLMCCAFLLVPTVNGFYWLLTALSTQLYLLMYILMFVAAIVIKFKKKANQTAVFQIPGGKIGFVVVCILGFIGCGITFIVDFFPPSNINVGGTFRYVIMFSVGLILAILPVTFFYFYRYFADRLRIAKKQDVAIS